MENTKYVRVSEAIAGAILERENVHPVFLHRNPDNTITAVFDEEPTQFVRDSMKKADETIVLLEPEYQADIEVKLETTVRFGFIAEPTDYS